VVRQAAARQLASRARRRVQGTPASDDAATGDAAAGPVTDGEAGAAPSADRARRRDIVDAFLTASRGGDFTTLLALLDPDVVPRSDAAAVQVGSLTEVLGAPAVAGTFSGRARAAKLAQVDGSPGAVWAQGGRTRVVFGFTITSGKIVAIDPLADADLIDTLDLQVLEA
jgi:hypothetical protein